MAEANSIKNKAVSLINDYFGEDTAKMYADFYKTQEDSVVLTSLLQLLTEFMGETGAKEVMASNGLTVPAN